MLSIYLVIRVFLLKGAMGSHQPQISGKCGTLGYTQIRGKSGSVDSDLQFLGLNNCQQDKGMWILTVS